MTDLDRIDALAQGLQRYRKAKNPGDALAMYSDLIAAYRSLVAENKALREAPIDVDRLATILTARMPDGSYWMNDDGSQFAIVHPRAVATFIAHLYATGDILSGLAALHHKDGAS